MASYIGIAIQNARLYASLEQKISEYERLKEFNENIVESINVGVFAVDLEERVESWNAQMEVMYAMSRQEAVGQYLRDILPANFVTEFLRLKDEPGVHNLYRFRLQTRSGENRCANVAIAPLVSRNFEVVGRIIIVDDITERMELEAQLTQADKLSSIGLLAAGVAHEVNTPSGRDFVLHPDAGQTGAGRSTSGAAAGQDHAADFPGLGNRQWPAEFFPHRCGGVHGS